MHPLGHPDLVWLNSLKTDETNLNPCVTDILNLFVKKIKEPKCHHMIKNLSKKVNSFFDKFFKYFCILLLFFFTFAVV